MTSLTSGLVCHITWGPSRSRQRGGGRGGGGGKGKRGREGGGRGKGERRGRGKKGWCIVNIWYIESCQANVLTHKDKC